MRRLRRGAHVRDAGEAPQPEDAAEAQARPQARDGCVQEQVRWTTTTTTAITPYPTTSHCLATSAVRCDRRHHHTQTKPHMVITTIALFAPHFSTPPLPLPLPSSFSGLRPKHFWHNIFRTRLSDPIWDSSRNAAASAGDDDDLGAKRREIHRPRTRPVQRQGTYLPITLLPT